MNPLSEMKTRALQSGCSEARVVFDHIGDLEESGLTIEQISSSLDELTSWIGEFKKALSRRRVRETSQD